MKTIDIYADPGHAWAAVPLAELSDLGIAHKISPYSYRHDTTAYLEEDCDLSLYIEALKAKGQEFKFKEHHTNHDSPIRNFERF